MSVIAVAWFIGYEVFGYMSEHQPSPGYIWIPIDALIVFAFVAWHYTGFEPELSFKAALKLRMLLAIIFIFTGAIALAKSSEAGQDGRPWSDSARYAALTTILLGIWWFLRTLFMKSADWPERNPG